MEPESNPILLQETSPRHFWAVFVSSHPAGCDSYQNANGNIIHRHLPPMKGNRRSQSAFFVFSQGGLNEGSQEGSQRELRLPQHLSRTMEPTRAVVPAGRLSGQPKL
jgi:hypothetical protein